MNNSSSDINNWADAIYAIAVESKKTKQYIEDISLLINILNMHNNELQPILAKRQSHIDDLTIQFIDKSFGKFIKDDRLINSIKLIVQNNLAHYIKPIFKKILKNLLLLDNKVSGQVYSAFPLAKTQIEAIEKKISKKLNVNVKLINIIDDELIGGVAVRVHDYYFDGSVKGIIHDLKKDIKANLERNVK